MAQTMAPFFLCAKKILPSFIQDLAIKKQSILLDVLFLAWFNANCKQEDETWTNIHPFFVMESSVVFPNGLLSLLTPAHPTNW